MITVIDYGAGNIGSVLRACAEVGAEVLLRKKSLPASLSEREATYPARQKPAAKA